MAAVVRSPPKCFPIASDTCRALLFPTRNIGGVCFCAPTRTSDNGRCRSFAPEMFFDCGGYPIGAIVLGHEHGGRMQYAPTRASDNGRCRSFAPKMFSDCGGYPIGAIVLGPDIGGVCFCAPTRTSENGRCRSFAPEMFSNTCARRPFASVGNHFMGHRHPFATKMFSNRSG